MKGEFEQRLRSVIDEVQASPTPIILFIDEAHTLIGAGGAGRHGRCRQSAEAGAGARHAAHHRRHHLGRIPPVHREGPGADPALPAGQCRRARRSTGCCYMLRGLLGADGEAPQGAHLRRGRGRGGRAVAPLHPGAPAARQGGEPARHRLRARRHQPERRRRPRSRTSRTRSTRASKELDGASSARRPRPRRRRAHRRDRTPRSPRSRTKLADLEAEVCRARTSIVDEIRQLRDRPRRPRPKATAQAARRTPRSRRRHSRRSERRTPAARATASGADRRARSRGKFDDARSAINPEQRMIYAHVDEQAVASVVSDWTGIPVGRMVSDEVADHPQARRHPQQARRRPGPRPADDRQAHRDQPRQARQSEQADRRVHAVRPVGRRQDRDRAGARRGALWRRAEHDHHQHVASSRRRTRSRC